MTCMTWSESDGVLVSSTTEGHATWSATRKAIQAVNTMARDDQALAPDADFDLANR